MNQNAPQQKTEQIFGKYVLKKLIRNEAECIKSFAAIQQGFDRLVEIRILVIPGAADSPMGKRFLEELKVLTSIDHPSIISILDQGVISGKHYFTTALHNSLRLDDYLKTRGGSLPEDDFLKFAEILTDAVGILHDDDKLHRGISTKSVFVNTEKDNGTPYIGECSAMKDIREESLTSLGLPTLGEYVPTPEGISSKPIDKRTDVFLLCNLFYEMLAGKPALPRTRNELIKEIRNNPSGFVSIPPLEIATRGSKKIPGIDELVMKGLDVEPDNRYDDANDLAEALRSVAKRHKVKLFLRENAAKTARMRAPKVTYQEREEKKKQEKAERRKNKEQNTLAKSGILKSTNKGTDNSSSGPEIPEKWIIGGGLSVAFILLLYIGSGFITTEPVTSSSGRPARSFNKKPKPGASKQLDQKILALAKQVKVTPTSDKDFKSRMTVFRTWLVANRGTSGSICKYTDLMKLRYRYLAMGDKKALTQLDRWIIGAEELISDPEAAKN